MELVRLGTLTFDMQSTVIENVPQGTRVLVEFDNIRIDGRFHARQSGPAGDWLIVGSDGTASLDIRFCLETDEGALVYVYGSGRTDTAEFARGGPMYFAPCFETGDPRHAWLNKVMAVAKGSATGSKARFELFELR